MPKTAKGLKSYITWDHGGDANGTSLQGELECDYNALVAVFGEPNTKGDQYKVDAEWTLTFTLFGTHKAVATIYNYKTGKNYLGSEGLLVEQIEDWHIGGNRADVVGYIASMLIAYYRTTT